MYTEALAPALKAPDHVSVLAVLTLHLTAHKFAAVVVIHCNEQASDRAADYAVFDTERDIADNMGSCCTVSAY